MNPTARILLIGLTLVVSDVVRAEISSTGDRYWDNLQQLSHTSSKPNTLPSSSQKDAVWRFDVSLKPQVTYSKDWVDHISGPLVQDMLRLEASRRLPFTERQWLFATVGASPVYFGENPDTMPLVGSTNLAASLGWQLNHGYGFTLAVEYEYRELGLQKANALQIGMHYLF